MNQPEGGEQEWLSSEEPVGDPVSSADVGVHYAQWRLEVGIPPFQRTREPAVLLMVGVLSLFVGALTFVLLGLRARHRRLLHSLIPPHVLSVHRDMSKVARKHRHVVTLFADICQYTEMSAGVDPAEVLRFINVLFAEFDRVCAALGILKLDTIADAYVAVAVPRAEPGGGGERACLPRRGARGGQLAPARGARARALPVAPGAVRQGALSADHAEGASERGALSSRRVAAAMVGRRSGSGAAAKAGRLSGSGTAPRGDPEDAALEGVEGDDVEALAESVLSCAMAAFAILSAASAVRFQGKAVQVRVGLHAGPVVSGVVGQIDNRPKWTMIGETMNIGSRMESTGCPSRVQCSAQFASLLRALGLASGFVLTPRVAPDGTEGVDVKGCGRMRTFWLEELLKGSVQTDVAGALRAPRGPGACEPIDEEEAEAPEARESV